MNKSVAEFMVLTFCLMAYMFGHDGFLCVFAYIVFQACGVPWELQHWRDKQEFSHVEEIPEE